MPFIIVGMATPISLDTADLTWMSRGPDTVSVWRHICRMAEDKGVKAWTWGLWKVGDFQDDMFSFCLRSENFKVFCSLADLAFVFQWELLNRADQAPIENAFETALDFADTMWRLDVSPETGPKDETVEDERLRLEKCRLSQIRRGNLVSHVTQALVCYLRRVPQTAREDEIQRLKRMKFLDPEFIEKISSALGFATSQQAAEQLECIESESRKATRKGAL